MQQEPGAQPPTLLHLAGGQGWVFWFMKIEQKETRIRQMKLVSPAVCLITTGPGGCAPHGQARNGGLCRQGGAWDWWSHLPRPLQGRDTGPGRDWPPSQHSPAFPICVLETELVGHLS